MQAEHDGLRDEGRAGRQSRFRGYGSWVAGVYLLSFLNPWGLVLSLNDGTYFSASSSFLAFATGFLCLIYSPVALFKEQVFPLLIGLAWLANPLFWVGILHLARREWSKAARMGALALLVALPAYQMSGMLSHSLHWWQNVVLPVGYLIWVISLAMLILPWACGAQGWDRAKAAQINADL